MSIVEKAISKWGKKQPDVFINKRLVINEIGIIKKIKRAQAYRLYNKEKHLVEEKKEGITTFVRLKPSNLQKSDEPNLQNQTNSNKILLEENAERLRAVVLELFRLYPEEFIVVCKSAKRRYVKLSLEKQIAQHEVEIEKLKRKLKE
jgi:hypothetical protein